MRSSLVLEPNRSYVIQATGVRNERRRGETAAAPTEQTLVWGFHTGGLPGTDYGRKDVVPPAPCDFADSPLNKVATYVARTVPQNGAPLFYRAYDVLVELTDPYAANMLARPREDDPAPVLSMRILDRNGKQIVPPPTFRFLTGGLPFLTPGLQAMLSAKREKRCAGVRVPWPRQFATRYIAGSLPDDVQPGKMVRVELVAALPYGPQSVFGFEFATSRYRDAIEHLASGLPRALGAPPPSRGPQPVRPLGRAAAPPLDWIADVEAKLATRATLRETLRAAHVFGPHDAGMTVDQARAAVTAATAELNGLCRDVYELLDRGGTLTLERTDSPGPTLSYAGIYELFVAAGLGHRPLPPRAIETLAIDTASGSFLLIESPEPLDWVRLTVRRADGSGAVLPVAWSSDGTRAFLFEAGARLFASGTHPLRLSYHRGGPTAPDLDPLYRGGELSPVEEEVIWDLQLP